MHNSNERFYNWMGPKYYGDGEHVGMQNSKKLSIGNILQIMYHHGPGHHAEACMLRQPGLSGMFFEVVDVTEDFFSLRAVNADSGELSHLIPKSLLGKGYFRQIVPGIEV
ncbi:MAG: hypothetical protein JST01_19765 [Cyanobacteria bacterium SZAS TMP-1]|nr:hypothetical protein [Cyanobacteria bacterium SZAS TMP-1]